ncbi:MULTISPECIES: hypothetical protein [unclassified Mesorhizobium]|uniref:hypothetical protein n=1 Tax=unclassified Mesorhizobium TaxID=325217 RepID=UPI0003CE6481|nr:MULTISPECIES: hypothetical protein [unclassified Mesorhizobium]ESY18277.1 hypothetical protein X751_17330 [Mesorhizobium sp. LNJC395A00]WJI73789.1 hypothetical protein NLY37_22650 [Mesorhizobium sp. C395A]
MFSLGEIDGFERQLRMALVTLNKKKIRDVTLIEAVDDAALWPEAFDRLQPIAPTADLNRLIARVPLFVCAVAAEIGFRFEGVGTEYWAKLEEAFGLAITMAQRAKIGEAFDTIAARYKISSPSVSAFSSHFSIIAWPIANALLPIDLIGPVTRLLARAPVAALPGTGRAINFPSLRAWASAVEGARLTDWLRFEAPTGRVLDALLAENRGSIISDASYARLRDAIGAKPEAFLAAKAARLRARIAKTTIRAEQTPGRLTLSNDSSVLRLFVTWPSLPPVLLEEARATARAAGWRPRLWGVGGLLHPDNALSAGPFELALKAVPANDDPAYPGAADVFGVGSDAAAALAARLIDWNQNLLFDPNSDRTRAEQRFDVLTGTSGFVWIATKAGGIMLDGLRRLGGAGGYTVYEANLAYSDHRAILEREKLLSAQSRSFLSRHPLDAIGAPQGVVRPHRPFLLYSAERDPDEQFKPQHLRAGERIPAVSGLAGRPGLRSEAASPGETGVADLILFERDAAFEAFIERRLQLRVESRLLLTDITITAELEIGGRLIARGRDCLTTLPMTVPSASPLLAPLYEDRIRAKLLEAGHGSLRISIARSITLQINLERPAASVEWVDGTPELVGGDFETELVTATAHHPHRFARASAIELPSRGAAAFGLKLADGRIADPIQLFTSNTFDLGDFTAHFGEDVGSRRMFDRGRGVGDIARARVAWARARCISLSAIAAKTRIVRQFEEPLVISLCGRSWSLAEQATLSSTSDPHAALWHIALERGLATVPESTTEYDRDIFARSFRRHAKLLDPEWPLVNAEPIDGAMDEALNAAFSESVIELHEKRALLDVDEDDCDFGSPAEDWERAAADALRATRRPALARLLAPSEGGRQLDRRSYGDLSVAELAEDLVAWTKKWALPRGQLNPEAAAGALHLWLSPAACDDVDVAVHAMAADPFVSRALRYAALRFSAETVEAIG